MKTTRLVVTISFDARNLIYKIYHLTTCTPRPEAGSNMQEDQMSQIVLFQHVEKTQFMFIKFIKSSTKILKCVATKSGVPARLIRS